MKFEILSKPSYALVEVALDGGEKIVGDSGAMTWMEGKIDTQTTTRGGIFTGLKRKILSGESFFQKNRPDWAPAWLEHEKVGDEEGALDYVFASEEASMVWIGNHACIELHQIHARRPHFDKPDYMVFDLAVNSGVSRAKKFLQEAVGVKDDGVIGPMTRAAIAKTPALTIVTRMSERREAFYRSLKTFRVFGKGWMRRLDEVTAQAREWARC